MKMGLQAGTRFRRAFSLVELLVVMAIVAILSAVTISSFQGVSGAKQFSNGLVQIAEILGQARAEASAQNTYVWVAFYPYDPSTLATPDNSGDALCVAVFASADGTDPINWNSTAVDLGSSGSASVSGTTISKILQIANFKQIAIRTQNYFTQVGTDSIPSLPSGIADPPIGPAAIPAFQISVPGIGLTLPAAIPTDAQTGQSISVIQFTPSGTARINNGVVDSIWIDFQHVKSKGVIDANNIAAVRINGLTGLTTIYRK